MIATRQLHLRTTSVALRIANLTLAPLTLALALALTLALALMLSPSTAKAAQESGVFYSNDTKMFHARLTDPERTILEGDKLFRSYFYGSSPNTIIPLKNTTPYTLTTDRSTRNLRKVSKDWAILNQTFSIYNGSLRFNDGNALKNNNNQSYCEVHNLGTNAILIKIQLKSEQDLFNYKHDKENHTIEISFYTQDKLAIRTAPNYNTGVLTDINWQTENLVPDITGVLTLTYQKDAPVEIANGRYWINIAMGDVQIMDVIPPTYRSNLTTATLPTPLQLNLHQFLPQSKVSKATGIEYVSLLPSGVLQVKLDGTTKYSLKRIGALKYRLDFDSISFIDHPINILQMSNNASISAVVPLKGIVNNRATIALIINTHKQIQLNARQSGSSLFIFEDSSQNVIKNMEKTVSIVQKDMAVTENGIKLTYAMSSPISIEARMVGRQLFIRFNNKITLSDTIPNPQIYLNNYVDTTAFGTLYGYTTFTIMFRRDVDVAISERGSKLVIDVKGL